MNMLPIISTKVLFYVSMSLQGPQPSSMFASFEMFFTEVHCVLMGLPTHLKHFQTLPIHVVY